MADKEKGDARRGDARMRDHATPTGVKEGFSNSEHELEVSGMRHAPEDRERRRESYSKAEIDENVVVSELSTTKKSALERREDERARAGGGRLVGPMASNSQLDEPDRHPPGEDETPGA